MSKVGIEKERERGGEREREGGERTANSFPLQLVVRKFEDPVGGDVNYPAFIQAIDEEYTGQTREREGEEREG